MKNLLTVLLILFAVRSAHSQITITSADMPIAGDTLRYSTASPVGSGIVLTDAGAGISWNYSFTPMSQTVDTYKLAFSVNPVYALTIGLTASGYKVADSFPIPIPLPGAPSVQQIYTFFEQKNSPNRYEAKAFAAVIAGFPTPINYTNPDIWYYFPLTFLRQDSARYKLNITLPTFGDIKEAGVRRTVVDGWGTITTPFYTTPTNCIRVRSEIHEIDSVQFGSFPSIGLPRNTVEYKWLVNGDHYPALWVTTTLLPGGLETISSIRYRDNPLPDTSLSHAGVPFVTNNIAVIRAFPNPANGLVTVDVPAAWSNYTIELFDMQSKQVGTFIDQHELNISKLPSGQYIARITSGTNVGYAQIVK